MSFSVKTPGLLIAALTLTSAAPIRSPWVGRWFYVAEESRHSPVSFTFDALSGGRIRFDDGSKAFILAPGGKSTPELLQPAASVRTEVLTPTFLRYVEVIKGHSVERVEQRLSPDHSRLIGRRTSIGQDGRESGHDLVSLRVGSGEGLAGIWREQPPAHVALRDNSSRSPRQPYWTISQDAAGTMTWRVIATGEVLRGKADGKRYASIGPRQPAGRNFSIKVFGPRHLAFFIYDHGHLITQTDETLSADGRRWTDLIWTPAHPDEKDRLVYRRG
jgi:hypothetical protein